MCVIYCEKRMSYMQRRLIVLFKAEIFGECKYCISMIDRFYIWKSSFWK